MNKFKAFLAVVGTILMIGIALAFVYGILETCRTDKAACDDIMNHMMADSFD